jgi:hypothetical protein
MLGIPLPAVVGYRALRRIWFSRALAILLDVSVDFFVVVIVVFGLIQQCIKVGKGFLQFGDQEKNTACKRWLV